MFLIAVSNVTKGKHMVPVLNELDVKAAVIGNHDFGKFFIIIARGLPRGVLTKTILLICYLSSFSQILE